MENFSVRTCLLPATPEHELAADMLSEAADAILAGNTDLARQLIARTDMPSLHDHARRVMDGHHTTRRKTVTSRMPGKIIKATTRMPPREVTRRTFLRDGWRCRFCDCRVVSPRARDAMRSAVPGALRWSKREGFHGAFLAMSASLDHVLPHSAGGTNELDNLVTACWSCQFGRGHYLLEEVGLSDPRERIPASGGWDGLERVQKNAQPATRAKHVTTQTADWFASLSERHRPAAERLAALIERHSDLGISCRINEVLILNMTVAGSSLAVIGVQKDGDICLPWSISDKKSLFRKFAITVASGIPDSVVYESPKQWIASWPGKSRFSVAELMDAEEYLVRALQSLHADLLAEPA